MAKKKTETKTTVVTDVPDNTIPGIEGGEFSFQGDVDSLLEQVKNKGSRVLIKVHKILAGHRPIYQFEQDSKVSETQLQQHGGGLYTLSYFIDGVRQDYTEEIEVADRPTNGNQPVTAETVQIQMLREQSQMNRDLLMAVLGRANPSVPSPTPMSEIATMWGLIHGIAPSGNGGGFEKLIEVLKTGIELGSRGNGGEMDWKTALISSLKEIAPSVVQVVAASKGVEMPQIASSQTQLETNPEQLLKQGLTLLKPRILGGLPVGLALDWVVANANDPTIQPFLSIAVKKQFQDLAQADPEVANEPYNTWLRQFLEGLKEHFKEANQPEEDSEAS